MRNAEWYMQAYCFLQNFKDYDLIKGAFCDGMMIHYCVRFRGGWLGPEIIHRQLTNDWVIMVEDRYLKLEERCNVK